MSYWRSTFKEFLFMKVIGLIKILDPDAFETYRAQVGTTVTQYGGSVQYRGVKTLMPWNELGCGDFDAFVELQFSDADGARAWVASPEYAALLPVRSKAMRLTLFGVA